VCDLENGVGVSCVCSIPHVITCVCVDVCVYVFVCVFVCVSMCV